jgi:hypothetical protein
MKNRIIMSILGLTLIVLGSCTSANRVVQGGGYGYSDPMYLYGPYGNYYNPGFYPRQNVIINRYQDINRYRNNPPARIEAPRSGRRPATVAPQNRRGNESRSSQQPRTRQSTTPSELNRRSTTPGRRGQVSAPRNTSPRSSPRSGNTPSRSRSGNN